LKPVQTCAFLQSLLYRVERSRNRLVLYHDEPASIMLQQGGQVVFVIPSLDVQHINSVLRQLNNTALRTVLHSIAAPASSQVTLES
jgi:hypothetical protein